MPKENRPQSPFKLGKAVNSPFKKDIATKLPTSEHIENLWVLPEKNLEEIKKVYKHLYSYVMQRNFEDNAPTSYHHVASAVLYEAHENVLIKGKDHAKKAGSIFNMVNNIISIINEELQNKKRLQSEQITVFEEHRDNFIAHRNLLVLALQKAPIKTQLHLSQHQNISVKDLIQIPQTPKTKKKVRDMYPSSPHEITPKKLSEKDKCSKLALDANKPSIALDKTRKRLLQLLTDVDTANFAKVDNGNNKATTDLAQTDKENNVATGNLAQENENIAATANNNYSLTQQKRESVCFAFKQKTSKLSPLSSLVSSAFSSQTNSTPKPIIKL